MGGAVGVPPVGRRRHLTALAPVAEQGRLHYSEPVETFGVTTNPGTAARAACAAVLGPSLALLTLTGLLTLTALVAPGDAHAGGPPESLVQAAVHPSNPDRIAMRWEFAGEGLVFTSDGGQTWQTLCLGGATPPDVRVSSLQAIAFDDDGHLYAGHFSGATRDDGTGCGFEPETTFGTGFMTGFAHHPADPSRLFAIAQLDNVSQTLTNRTYERGADGAWVEIDVSPGLLYGMVVAALPNGGTRIYQLYGTDPLFDPNNPADNWPSYRIRYSDDGGANWTVQAVYDVGSSTNRLFLEAVDPTDPDRLVLSLRRSAGSTSPRAGLKDEVLVSGDRGATFATYATIEQFGGLDMGPGGQVWIGDQGDGFDLDVPAGLWTASDLGTAPTKATDSYQATCVKYLPGRDALLICSRTRAGVTGTDGTDFQELFSFGAADRLVYCADGDTLGTCQQQFTRFWCLPAHFEAAPMCCGYESALQTPNMPRDCSAWDYGPGQDNRNGTDGGMPGATDAGGAGGAGNPPSSAGSGGSPPSQGGEGSGDGGQAPGTGTDAGNSGGTDSADASGDDGCGCRIAGGKRPRGASAPLSALAIGFLALARLGRRRR